jgi:hypothetical protein
MGSGVERAFSAHNDVEVGDSVAVTATALSASMFRQQLEGLAPYGRVLVFLDACRSGGPMGVPCTILR